jgi:hypothetical protein
MSGFFHTGPPREADQGGKEGDFSDKSSPTLISKRRELDLAAVKVRRGV